jgi:hypothetical protein
MVKTSNLTILPLILVAVCVISLPANAERSIYVFDPVQSTVIQTGGFAGVNETYSIIGQFRLSVDSDTGIALFETVDANLADETGAVYGQSLNEIFNMTGLTATVVDETTIEFEGKTADGTESDVNLKLNLQDGSVHLTGKTTPPPNSADLFFYEVNAVAIRKYAGGTGEPNDPYLIYTAEQLNAIGAEQKDWDKNFKMIADINLQEYSGEQFNIIGTMRDKFVGSFDGAGFTISNFRYSAGNRNFIGLFNQVGDGAQIKDVILDNVEIEVEKGSSVGALVGFNLRGIISGCRATVSVIGGDGSGNLGALVGFNSWGTVSNCSASGSVTGVDNVSSIGGLVGNNASGEIYDCLATTTVSGGPGSSNIGGLVGYSQAGTISNSYAVGNISGDKSLGGLAGYKNDGSIIQCYAIGEVSGNSRIGGLVGRNDSGIISDCYATGRVDGDDALGGLVGRNHKGSVNYSYAAGMVSGNSRLGGLVGNEDRGSYVSSFWDTDANPGLTGAGDIDPDPNDIVGETTAEMQTASTFLEAGWDFVEEAENGTEDIWKVAEGQTYPLLSWQKYGGGSGEPNNPYLIYNAEHLNALGAEPNDYNKHFKLMADIDLSGYTYDRAVIAPDADTLDTGFQGIPFSGLFDGSSHAILNLRLSGGSHLGLFGGVGKGGKVQHLVLVGIEVNGTSHIGAFAGESQGDMTDCHSDGVVTGTVIHTGGLIGSNSQGNVTRCSSASIVRGNRTVGGLIGDNDEGTIRQCRSTGAVTGELVVGGLVGGTYRTKVVNCYSIASVEGTDMVGGFAGNAIDIAFSACYSAGSVHGTTIYVGGFLGKLSRGIPDEVVGPAYLGLSEEELLTCFWDQETSGQTGNPASVAMRCLTTEMQTARTFLEAGWDFVGETVNGPNDIWWIFEGQDYPRLWWERVLGDDFEDGEALPQWQIYEPDSEKIRVEETNGRLEVHADDTADDIVAGYVSSGWRLDVTSDFALRADFHFSKIAAGDSWVMLLLLPSLDEPVNRFNVLEAGCLENQPFYLHEIEENGSIIQEASVSRSIDDGTLYISYDADTDELYMSYSGYGKPNAWQTVEGLLKNQWAAQPVYVVIGGGSDRVVLDTGNAYLDNFVIDSGILDLSEAIDDTEVEEP